MSITDELREYTEEQIKWLDMTKVHYRKLFDIADRIDAEHESAMYDMRREHDEWVADRDANWVKLPKDADGEPWRLGDKLLMEGEVCEVIGIGGHTIFYAFGDGVEWTIAHNNRHYHAPTVEDVLREFAEKMNENMGLYTGEVIDADEWRDADNNTIAEYAAKLQLREVDG